jgi:hypothetical protein
MDHEFVVRLKLKAVKNDSNGPFTPYTKEQAQDTVNKLFLGENLDWGGFLSDVGYPDVPNTFPDIEFVSVESV